MGLFSFSKEYKPPAGGILQASFAVTFPNSSTFAFIECKNWVDIYYTYSAGANSLFWNTLDSRSQMSHILSVTGAATISENMTNIGASIAFGGTAVITIFQNPIRTRNIRIFTGLGGGSSGTVTFFYKNVV